jgi:hypothetical protein
VELALSGYHFFHYALADWRSGGLPGSNTDNLPTDTVPALNAPRLTRKLCSPLHRWPTDEREAYLSGPRLEPYQYDRPWGLTKRGGDAAYLERCGTTKATPLCSECAPVLGSGYVTWVEPSGGRVIALRLRDRQRFFYPLADANATTQAGRRLFVMQTVGNFANARTYVGALPR